MTSLREKGQPYLELYSAIAHFIGRQQIVARAVVEQGVALSQLTRGVTGWHDKTPQRGEWDEWHFFFHGGGCRLTHRETGEPIDWNGPDPNSFDPYFFLGHLEWRLKHHKADVPYLRGYVDQHGLNSIIGLVDDLIAEGIIGPDHHLTPQVDNSRANAA